MLYVLADSDWLAIVRPSQRYEIIGQDLPSRSFINLNYFTGTDCSCEDKERL